MAKLKVNGAPVSVDNISTVGDVIGNAPNAIVTDKNGKMKLITAQEARNKNIEEAIEIDPTFTSVDKGSTIRATNYLQKEIPSISQYLSSLETNNGKVAQLKIINLRGCAFLEIFNFPLPERFGYNDTEDKVLLALPDYPSQPPLGIYIQKNSPNLQKIKDALGGHVFGRTMDFIKNHQFDELDEVADWICFHYEVDTNQKRIIWHYDYNNVTQKDCLYKYLKTLFIALH